MHVSWLTCRAKTSVRMCFQLILIESRWIHTILLVSTISHLSNAQCPLYGRKIRARDEYIMEYISCSLLSSYQYILLYFSIKPPLKMKNIALSSSLILSRASSSLQNVTCRCPATKNLFSLQCLFWSGNCSHKINIFLKIVHVIIYGKSNKILSKAGLFIICGPPSNIEGPYDTDYYPNKGPKSKRSCCCPSQPSLVPFVDAHYLPFNLKFKRIVLLCEPEINLIFTYNNIGFRNLFN